MEKVLLRSCGPKLAYGWVYRIVVMSGGGLWRAWGQSWVLYDYVCIGRSHSVLLLVCCIVGPDRSSFGINLDTQSGIHQDPHGDMDHNITHLDHNIRPQGRAQHILVSDRMWLWKDPKVDPKCRRAINPHRIPILAEGSIGVFGRVWAQTEMGGTGTFEVKAAGNHDCTGESLVRLATHAVCRCAGVGLTFHWFSKAGICGEIGISIHGLAPAKRAWGDSWGQKAGTKDYSHIYQRYGPSYTIRRD